MCTTLQTHCMYSRLKRRVGSPPAESMWQGRGVGSCIEKHMGTVIGCTLPLVGTGLSISLLLCINWLSVPIQSGQAFAVQKLTSLAILDLLTRYG